MQADRRSLRRLGQGGAQSPLEARAGAFLEQARCATGLSDGEIGAIERKLFAKPRRVRVLRLWPAVAAMVLLLATATGLALVGGWRPSWPAIGPAPHLQPRPAGGKRIGHVEHGAPVTKEPARPVPVTATEAAATSTLDGSRAAAELPTRPLPSAATQRRSMSAQRAVREARNDLPINAMATADPAQTTAVRLAPPPRPADPDPLSPSLREAARSSWAWGTSSPEVPPALGAGPAASPPALAVAPKPSSGEARSLAEALSRWRRGGDAEAALGLLGVHDRRYPHGSFAVESKVARAEILLAIGRRDEALTVLDSLSLTGLPRGRELRLIRGELRVRAGRCRDGRADLSDVLAGTTGDELARRASLALAACP